jgi:hypothetical protein
MEANSGRASGMAVAFDQLAMRARSFDQPNDQRREKLTKLPQQAFTRVGMENHQRWLDPGSHPVAEKFRASSSWRSA